MLGGLGQITGGAPSEGRRQSPRRHPAPPPAPREPKAKGKVKGKIKGKGKVTHALGGNGSGRASSGRPDPTGPPQRRAPTSTASHRAATAHHSRAPPPPAPGPPPPTTPAPPPPTPQITARSATDALKILGTLISVEEIPAISVQTFQDLLVAGQFGEITARSAERLGCRPTLDTHGGGPVGRRGRFGCFAIARWPRPGPGAVAGMATGPAAVMTAGRTMRRARETFPSGRHGTWSSADA